MLEHLRDLRVGQHQAVLDRVASAVERALQAFSAIGVAGDFLSPAVSFVHNRAQFLDRERGLRNQFAVLAHPRAVRHVDLDPVGAVVELLARRFARLDRTVDDLHAFRHFDLRRVAFKRISAGGRNCARRNKHPRPGNISALDGHLDADIAIARTFGLHVAHGREALFERAPRRNRGSRRAKGQRILQQLNVVSALGWDFPLQKDVRVRIDQARAAPWPARGR